MESPAEMPEFEPTGLARVPLLLLHHVDELGLEREELMRAAGLTEEELVDPDARVPVNKTWSLWRIVIDRVDDPALGLRLGAAARIREFGIVGYTMYYSATLRDAFCRLARYSHIISKALQYHLQHEADHTRLLLESNPQFDALRHPLDARLAVVVAAAREITQWEILPIEVHFPYERPVQIAEHQRFFRCSLEFDRPQPMILFRDEDLDRAVAGGDETLSAYLDRLAEDVLRSLEDRSSLRDRVQRAIWAELAAGPPTLGKIASVLGISARTLQRRLRESGTSFGRLLDSFRHGMALRLLRDKSLAVYEVAFLLGYSDPSTFYRAFRRWRGAPPDEFRRTAG
jgi:AraC-like DNA-binding protein